MSETVIEVLLDRALDRPLDYVVPNDMGPVKVGMRVEVPLKSQNALGTISALKKTSAFKNVKSVTRLVHEKPLVSEELFALAKWISTYYACPLNRVLKSILPPMVRKETKDKTQLFIKPLFSRPELASFCETIRKKSPARAKVLDELLQQPKGMLLTELAEKAKVTAAPIQALVKQEVLSQAEVRMDRSPIFAHDFFPTKPKQLTNEQALVLEAIASTIGHFQPHLLFGVTGSGKTEVYLQAIEKVIETNKRVLYLVPEISLTSQTIERFKGRFGETTLAILHHRLSNGERFDTWQNIHQGKVSIVIGARSALFSPLDNLGLIIVDEEHEAAYKQSEEGPKYHARDMAIVRAKLADCPIILGSATPSIESFANARKGKYQLHTLKSRPKSAQLPKVHIVDMKGEYEKSGGYTLFSRGLVSGIEKRLEKGEQTLLFLNRRGYHTSAGCPKCAHVMECPHCEMRLTYHKGEHLLACHLCDYNLQTPRQCPSCGGDGPLKFKGVGTELVQKSLHALFPDIRSLRLDADTTRHKGSHEKIYKAFKSGKADVLIGTQMIAKGLHFPMVTLACILNVDGSLNIPDFRSAENVFQLLTQVAGRSGRGEFLGEVIVQTQIPDHPIIQHGANQDYEAFYNQEIEERKLFGFPPFTHLVKCTFSGTHLQQVESAARGFQDKLQRHLPKEAEIFPVIACGYAKIGGKFRFQCLIKSEKVAPTVKTIETLRASFPRKGDLRLTIDVDPLSTFF